MRISDISIPDAPGAKDADLKKNLKTGGKTFRKGTIVEFIELDKDLTGLSRVIKSHPFTTNGEERWTDRVYCSVNGKLGWHNITRFTYFNNAKNLNDFDNFIKESKNEVVDAVREAQDYEEFYRIMNGRTITFSDEFTFLFKVFGKDFEKESKLSVYR